MSNQIVNVDEAQDQFANLIKIASEGWEVIITKDGKPLARLVPISKPTMTKRIAGLNRGTIWTSQDFDEPLSDHFWMGQE